MNENPKEVTWWRRRRNLLVLTLLIVVASLLGSYQIFVEQRAAENPPVPIEDSEPKEEAPISLSIVSVGDVMVHKPQIASQYDSSTGTYNFENNFQYVKGYIEGADLALCNVETTFGGGSPSGYPTFNAPDALADALVKTGFDVGMTSNNHLYDTGYDGLKRTLRVLREAGILTTGTQFPGERNYTMVSVKGLDVAVISYTYETPSANGRTTINSATIPEEAEALINSFNYDTMEEDLTEVKTTIDNAKANGADLVICYYHWGEEYQREPNQWQKAMAEKTAEMGADMIFASHPHVLQKVEMITVPDTGRQVPVFYCMGNFLSNQRAETINNRYTEQGMIAHVTLDYDKKAGKIVSIKMDAMRTWLDKYKSQGKDVYAIIPLDNQLEENETLQASGHLFRARQASEDVAEVLGSSYIWQ